MKIISITGTASGVGKTTVAQFLLRHFTGLSALKITTKHEGNCPRHSDCDLCKTMVQPYKISVDPLEINQQGKDTSIFKNSGARKVVWLQTHSEFLETGIANALTYFNDNDIVVVEGNSFLHTHDADLCVLVTTPREMKIKRSTRQIISKIDIAVINKHTRDTNSAIMESQERLHLIGCYAPVFIVNPVLENYKPNELFIKHIKEALGQPLSSLTS